MVNVGKYPITMDPMGFDLHAKRENSNGAGLTLVYVSRIQHPSVQHCPPETRWKSKGT